MNRSLLTSMVAAALIAPSLGAQATSPRESAPREASLLERYAAARGLGVVNDSGALTAALRTTRLFLSETRDWARAAERIAPPTPLPECPMPVARIDSARVGNMPVALADSAAAGRWPARGAIIGCVNPLAR